MRYLFSLLLACAACAPATVTPVGYTVTSNVPKRVCPPGNVNTAFPSSGKVRCEGDDRFPGPRWGGKAGQ